MTQTKIYASRKGSKIAPKPNSTSDPKPTLSLTGGQFSSRERHTKKDNDGNSFGFSKQNIVGNYCPIARYRR